MWLFADVGSSWLAFSILGAVLCGFLGFLLAYRFAFKIFALPKLILQMLLRWLCLSENDDLCSCDCAPTP